MAEAAAVRAGDTRSMKVAVIGSGYVGLVTGACLAERGHDVVCVDIDADKVAQINSRIPPIHEVGLQELLDRNVGRRLRATTDLVDAVTGSDLTCIAVGTPFDGQRIDLRYVRGAAAAVGRALRRRPDYHVVVVKSTVVPGTTEELVTPLLERESGKRAGVDFGVGMNPEFLREGTAVEDFLYPDRVVLGAFDARAMEAMERLYEPFPMGDLLRTDTRTAEVTKYALNSLLATLISFSNEIANLCTAMGGVDVVEVMKGVHLDRRLSPILEDGTRVTPSVLAYLEAGCGFGGSCFPKDLRALIAHGRMLGTPMRLLDSVVETNDDQPDQMLALLRKHYRDLRGLSVSVLGLAFKPGTGDMRQSPAIPIVRTLLDEGATVRAYDPMAAFEARTVFAEDEVMLCDSLPQALDGVDVVMLVTRWEEFRAVPELLRRRSPQPLLVDGRRIVGPQAVERYEGIGLCRDPHDGNMASGAVGLPRDGAAAARVPA